MWVETFRALTTTFRVAADDDRVAALAAELFAAYSRDGTAEPDVDYRMAADGLYVDGQLVMAVDHHLDLVPSLELHVFDQIIARAEERWLVHAASVVVDGCCVVLAGPSGAGKSTAAWIALEQLGAIYICDEHTAITEDGMVTGVPRPLTFDESVATALRRSVYPIRQADGSVVNHELVHPELRSVARHPRPLHAVALLRYNPGASRLCRRISVGQALSLLWSQTMNTGEQVLQCASAALTNAQCYEVVSASTDDIAQSLRELATAK